MNPLRATQDDAAAIVRMYNEGIAERIATFETEPRTVKAIGAWFGRLNPIVVVEREGRIVAFAVRRTMPAHAAACPSTFGSYAKRHVCVSLPTESARPSSL